MARRSILVLVAAAAAAVVVATTSRPAQAVDPFQTAIDQILAQPYEPAYAPSGFDSAFLPDNVLDTLPAQDYTSGSVPGDPDHPNWPAPAFTYVRYFSGDGAPLRARVALHSGTHPGIVVVHGFNTNGKESIIRWAAMLYASGYNVIASDQRDFKDEYQPSMPPTASDGYPNWLQTFGWKESQDVLAAGQYLKSKPGVGAIGVVGFSEGAQNTVLALARDTTGIFSAGLTFSGPADQNAQIYSTAQPPGCTPGPGCTYPATNSLIALVVPPYGSGGKYNDPCQVLTDAGTKYGSTPLGILNEEKAFQAQTSITVPLLNFYAADDSLVQPFHATMMAGYEQGNPLQRTIEIQQGEHAYFFDRWWDQKAILLYFKGLLPGALADGTIKTDPTVAVPVGGTPMSGQLVSLGNPTPADADALQRPFVCPTPTAATFSALGAAWTGRNVVVRWRTASEAETLGFHLYRQVGTGRQRLDARLIPARGSTHGASYSFRDPAAAGSGVGRYWVEEVRLDGSRTLHGPARVVR